MLKTLTIAAAAACFVVPAQAASVADPYTSFMVLGDSLSDPGNIPQATWQAETGGAPFFDAPDNPLTPFEEGGTFSTGQVWADVLTQQFSAQFKPTYNLASGGATAGTAPSGTGNDLPEQQLEAQSILENGGGGARPLMAYWFGANDIFIANQIFKAGGSIDPTPLFNAGALAASNIADSIESSISLHSVTDFLVMNLPSFDLIPLFNGDEPATRAVVRSVSDNFNASLLTELAAPAALGANITVLDVNDLFSEVLADPSALGYLNVTDACVTTSSVCAEPDTYLFIDNVHPTAAAHARIGAAASAALAPVPLPAGVWLLLGGLGALALRKRAA